MKPRSSLPQKERSSRSRAAKIIHDMPFILGSLVEMANTCGKPNCKCMKGEKHRSWCLAVRHKGKRKMIHIPRGQEDAIFEGIKAYQELWEQLEAISQASLARILPTIKSKE